VTKAISKATERRQALKMNGWEFVDTFKTYQGYYQTQTNQ